MSHRILIAATNFEMQTYRASGNLFGGKLCTSRSWLFSRKRKRNRVRIIITSLFLNAILKTKSGVHFEILISKKNRKEDKKRINYRIPLTCLFRKETTRSHFTEIQLLRAYQISRTKTSQTIESLVQASGFPLHRHGYTVVIKLKGPAISLPPNIAQKADTYWKDWATTCPRSFRGTHSIRMDTRIECQTGNPVRRTEKTDPSVQTLSTRIVPLFEYPCRSALFLHSLDSKILLSRDLSYAISAEILPSLPG